MRLFKNPHYVNLIRAGYLKQNNNEIITIKIHSEVIDK